jgi:hypothetical protein
MSFVQFVTLPIAYDGYSTPIGQCIIEGIIQPWIPLSTNIGEQKYSLNFAPKRVEIWKAVDLWWWELKVLIY